MGKLKQNFMAFLSSGTHTELEETKKLALQIANFDALLTAMTLFFYIIISLQHHVYPLYLTQPFGLLIVVVGFYLIRRHYYDLGRYLIHFNGLVQIFITADAYPANSGYEYYYIVSLIVPFVTFSLDEKKKSIFLSSVACLVLVFQIFIGPGHIAGVSVFNLDDKIMAMVIVLLYILTVLGLTKWQMNAAQLILKRQQAELIHTSNLIALGEMSGGIAHEINNPLQTLTLQSGSIRRKLMQVEGAMSAVGDKLDIMDRTIFKIARMVKGMKDLSRNVSGDPLEDFSVKDVIDEILLVSSQKFQNHGVEIKVTGEIGERVHARNIQLSQVLVNLLNNSVDAIEGLQEKWIAIDVKNKKSFIEVSVTDSGHGIPDEVSRKIMQPFFTTKEPGKGTGLGLSISHNLIEKLGGKLYYDHNSARTRFVLELPPARPA